MQVNILNSTKSNKMPRKSFRNSLSQILDNGQLYLMALPAVLLLFVFAYFPLFGLIIAFKDFDFSKGIFGSDWLNPIYDNFLILIQNNPDAFRAIKNTILLNLLFISVGTVFALMLSVMFNEIRNGAFKKITQSVTFLPYFISTVVVGIFVSGILSYETGSLNHFLEFFGLGKLQFYAEPKYWPWILLAINIWKGAGYSSVIYLATIAGIDTTYYEAAQIDGASRWQQMRSITLPMLMPTVIILTLLAVGRIMNSDFGLFYNVTGDVPTIYSSTDVIDTYIYRALRMTGDIGISSATGFFQSVVSFAMVIIFNKLASMYEKEAALF